jgi:hypothetical protein
VAEAVAQRALAGVAHVQRAGGVGGDELDHQLLAVGCLAAEALGARQHLGHHGLLGRRLEPEVDEARAGDLHRVDPALHRLPAAERLDQRLRQLARVLLQRAGELHRRGAGEVAMRRLLGVLEHRLEGRARYQLGQRLTQGAQQLVLGFNHPAILKGGCLSRTHCHGGALNCNRPGKRLESAWKTPCGRVR